MSMKVVIIAPRKTWEWRNGRYGRREYYSKPHWSGSVGILDAKEEETFDVF